MLTKYKLAPQTKFYDSMDANWRPFIMFSQFPNVRSKFCNTDINGLRFNNFQENNTENSIFEEKIDKEKKTGIIVGNSFAFGEGSTNDKYTISNYLSEKTNSHYYNLCGRGFSGFQEITNFFLHLNHLKKLDKIIVISGCNDAFLPYLDYNHENYLEPTHGYKLFKSSMDKAARGWKNKTLKLIFGSFFKKTNWSRINSLNWKDEIFKKETISYKNKPSDPNEHLSLIIDNNIRLWSIISQGMNIDISYVLQPVGSWSKKKLTDEEKKLFSEEILIEGQDRIYKHIDFKKYNLIKSILEHSTKKYKINFLDLNAHFNNEKYNNEWLFLSRFHFNDVGNKHLSSYLISKLF